MTEAWLTMVGYEGGCEVSSLGRVRSLSRTVAFGNRRRAIPGQILLNQSHPAGYVTVKPKYQGRRASVYVHRAVAEAFLGPSLGRDVNHKNGIKTDNRLENLEWVTRAENLRHARETGLVKNVARRGMKKTPPHRVAGLVFMTERGMTISDAARATGTNVTTALGILKRHREVPGKWAP